MVHNRNKTWAVELFMKINNGTDLLIINNFETYADSLMAVNFDGYSIA